MSALAKALQLAARGFHVFPCNNAKEPTCKRGFLAASNDPDHVTALFRSCGGDLVGMPTGTVNGFDVLDWDPKNGGAESIAALRSRIPATREQRTRSGGGHLIFLHSPGVRNTQSKIARGIDTRGEGGYIIFWPAHGCLVTNVADPAPWPACLLAELLRKPEPTISDVEWKRRISEDDTYARRVIQNQLQRVASARPGKRHDTLRAASKIIGGILDLDKGTTTSEATARLLSAVKEAGGKDVVEKNAKATIDYALEWGKARPLTLRGDNG